MGTLLLIVYFVAQAYAVYYDNAVQNIGASWRPAQVAILLSTIILICHRVWGDSGAHSGARRTPTGMVALCLVLFQGYGYGGAWIFDIAAAYQSDGLMVIALIGGFMSLVVGAAGIAQTVNALSFFGTSAGWDKYTDRG
jgi:hypothetical protein